MSRLTKSKIIKEVGEEHYRSVCGEMRQKNDSTRPERSVVNKIVTCLEHSKVSKDRVLTLLMSFYEDLPSYRFMMDVKTGFYFYDEKEKQSFWKWVRKILDSGDTFKTKNLCYALWVDFFEDPQTVDEAWASLLEPLPSETALQEILIHSGTVPWEKKWSLFVDLIGKPEMHYYIFRSILHSQFDVYGKLNHYEAFQILSKLKIPSGTEHLSKLYQVALNTCL